MRKRAALDWKVALARLEQARKGFEQAGSPAANRERIFRRRAELLARPLPAEGIPAEREAILIFHAGDGRYGVPLSRVSEVIHGAALAPVPGAAPRIAGVIQVRGEIRLVLDLARLLGVESQEAASAAVVLLSYRGREVGVRTGPVDDIRTAAEAGRRAAPHGSPHAAWMTGDLVTVLDVDSLLEGES